MNASTDLISKNRANPFRSQTADSRVTQGQDSKGKIENRGYRSLLVDQKIRVHLSKICELGTPNCNLQNNPAG